jgi:hypothetical protein
VLASLGITQSRKTAEVCAKHPNRKLSRMNVITEDIHTADTGKGLFVANMLPVHSYIDTEHDQSD